MRILTTISDARQYRQLSKQLNQDLFDGITREVQENELTEFLGETMATDFFDYLDNNWTTQLGVFTRNSDYQLTAANLDLSSFNNYALRLNDEMFVIVDSAVFDGTDTIIKVSGYVLPQEISLFDHKAENNYIKLLNGDTYNNGKGNVKYNGLRPFISWTFLSIYTMEGNVKHTDVGNISIMPENGRKPNGAELRGSRSLRQQNSLREYNRIAAYLSANKTSFPLWESKDNENLTNLEFIII